MVLNLLVSSHASVTYWAFFLSGHYLNGIPLIVLYMLISMPAFMLRMLVFYMTEKSLSYITYQIVMYNTISIHTRVKQITVYQNVRRHIPCEIP